MIPFNKTCVIGKELQYIQDAIQSGQIAGDGKYSKKCQEWFSQNYQFKYNLLTTSCSTSLDMSALLLEISPGDEVIMPSYTFVSTANSFAVRGAKIKFVDIRPDTMNLDETKVEAAITAKTKAIIPVHYAGVSCEMDYIMDIAKNHNLHVVEDAAQAMMCKYKQRRLGSIGDIGCFSFHATKNYTSAGEGGLLVLSNELLFERAEVIREKGTNRSKFLHGLTDKYTWVDIGSSYLPSDISAAYLLAQLENAEKINSNRLNIWNRYNSELKPLKDSGKIELPFIPSYCEHNAHMYYIKFQNSDISKKFIKYSSERKIIAPFHYVPLHSSPAGLKHSTFVGEDKFTTFESSRLARLPIFYNMDKDDQSKVIDCLFEFIKNT